MFSSFLDKCSYFIYIFFYFFKSTIFIKKILHFLYNFFKFIFFIFIDKANTMLYNKFKVKQYQFGENYVNFFAINCRLVQS